MEHILNWYGSDDPRYHRISNHYSNWSLKFNPELNTLVGVKGAYVLGRINSHKWVGMCAGIVVTVIISNDKNTASVVF